MRATFVNTLAEMARRNEKIMCVIGDTGFSVFEGFEREFGPRFINVGIAEQDFIGFGAGLAAMGMKPYLYNVASFMAYRSYEQILLDIAYQENPAVLVAVGGGHAYGTAGPTHHAYFDIAMMRQLPNMAVVCPADPIEMRAAMLMSEHYDKPMYIRIGRSVDPVLYNREISFELGKAICLRNGEDVALMACGVMVKDAVEACNLLEKRGISAALWSVHTIKPIDEDLIRKCMSRYPFIFTLEEHSAIGGLGSAVGDVMLEHPEDGAACLIKLDFPDTFAPVTGTREYLNGLYGLDATSVANRIASALEKES